MKRLAQRKEGSRSYEHDVHRKRKLDLATSKAQKTWVEQIAQGRFDMFIVALPGSTFLRAMFGRLIMGLLLRSLRCPRGFSWNTGEGFRKAEYVIGRIFIRIGLMEQPEDINNKKWKTVVIPCSARALELLSTTAALAQSQVAKGNLNRRNLMKRGGIWAQADQGVFCAAASAASREEEKRLRARKMKPKRSPRR